MQVDNSIYSTLGARWYEAKDDPVALLRAESRLRNPWIGHILEQTFDHACSVLDMGCGAGFLANDLAARGHHVVGVDAAPEALAVARLHDGTRSVNYRWCDALDLPFPSGSFEAVCAMDFLEHVEDPEQAIREAARVLAPGGLFFFHTFNRSWFSWLIVIKGVEWFVRNTPPNMHVLQLFRTPEEVEAMCKDAGLYVEQMVGMRPRIDSAFLEMLFTGTVPEHFRFDLTSSLDLAYMGIARKGSNGWRLDRL